jgi:signal transduction histidine kinase
MKIKYFILYLMSLLAVLSSLIFTVIVYRTHSKALLDGLDQKLVTAAHYTKALLPEDFHDNIIDENSVLKDDYLKIVDSYNKLCSKLGMEYVWSLMLIDGKTVFTTGTSTSKDVTKGDHASFFEAHSNPELYTNTFNAMEPHYQINDDKWGRIKVVLIPFKDKHGRPYLFGASMKITEVDAIIKSTLNKALFVGGIIVFIGIVFSFTVAKRLSNPLEEVTKIAHQIAAGNLDQEAVVRGCIETKSLSESINVMNESIRKQFYDLQSYNEQLVNSKQQLKTANEELTAHEQQLRASNQQLEAKELEQSGLLTLLESKNEELESVVYAASHDLKSPLVNISGFSGELNIRCEEIKELLESINITDEETRGKISFLLNDDIPNSIKFITSSASKSHKLLNGLLQVSRVGSEELKIETLEMNKLMLNVTDAFAFHTKEEGISVTIDDLPDCIGDIKQINQVFSNLLGNAISYLDPARQGVIKVSGQVYDKECIYCMEDNGIGIHKNHQSKVFELFHRLNPDDSTDSQGLGLTITKRALGRNNGWIWVESEEGKGCKFFAALPGKLEA